jgi:hypothetical protein
VAHGNKTIWKATPHVDKKNRLEAYSTIRRRVVAVGT